MGHGHLRADAPRRTAQLMDSDNSRVAEFVTSRNRVARDFLARPAVDVAPDLLGCVLMHRTSGGIVAVRISEVEAYMGGEDPGSHAYRGKTARNWAMFEAAGHLYVYRHMGLHFCVNVVCGEPDRATGVLIRAGEVVQGDQLARDRRARVGVVKHDRDLARGPARLTVALGIDWGYNGHDLVASSDVTLVHGEPHDAPIRSGPRVGISGAGGDGGRYPWRFWLADDPSVSAYRASKPRSG